MLRWRRHGIAAIWKHRSHGRWQGGRPRIAVHNRQLIREMARANFLWGASRIHGERLKLGIIISQAISRYMPVSQEAIGGRNGGHLCGPTLPRLFAL